MKKHFYPFIAVILLLATAMGCKKTDETPQPTKCNDFNNRQTINIAYGDTILSDMSNYFGGSPNATFQWKVSVPDGCDNAPIVIDNKITLLADDTLLTIRMGYTFDKTNIKHYIALHRSEPYTTFLHGKKIRVVDYTNAESTFNECTNCLGHDPTPLSIFIEAQLPSINEMEDTRIIRQKVKFVGMKLIYIYNLD